MSAEVHVLGGLPAPVGGRGASLISPAGRAALSWGQRGRFSPLRCPPAEPAASGVHLGRGVSLLCLPDRWAHKHWPLFAEQGSWVGCLVTSDTGDPHVAQPGGAGLGRPGSPNSLGWRSSPSAGVCVDTQGAGSQGEPPRDVGSAGIRGVKGAGARVLGRGEDGPWRMVCPEARGGWVSPGRV